jgi:hypothetical protein
MTCLIKFVGAFGNSHNRQHCERCLVGTPINRSFVRQRPDASITHEAFPAHFLRTIIQTFPIHAFVLDNRA